MSAAWWCDNSWGATRVPLGTWTEQQLAVIGDAFEIDIATMRADDTVRRPVPIWVIRRGDDLFVRSYRGPSGSWFRQAIT